MSFIISEKDGNVQVDIRAKNARVYVEEVTFFEVMEKDLNLEIEDKSPEMYAATLFKCSRHLVSTAISRSVTRRLPL